VKVQEARQATAVLGGEAGAALGAASSQHRTTCASPHAGAESVGLGSPTIIRLVGALGHGRTPKMREGRDAAAVLDNPVLQTGG
jgi:hypothetical protein